MKRRRELSGALALSLDGSAALEPPARRRAQLTSSLYARSFAHHAQQLKHRGCVNALALSPRDARWFASGGDDMRTLVYRANDDFSSSKPVACFHGPRGNIFSIAFVADDSAVLTAGLDSKVYSHDLGASGTTSSVPTEVWSDADAAVTRVCAHPHNANIFMASSEDGVVRMYDRRAGSNEAVADLSEPAEMNDVEMSPTEPTQFIVTDRKGHIFLHDARKAFADNRARGTISSDLAVMNYATVLSAPRAAKGGKYGYGIPSTSSVAFAPDGRAFVATMSRHEPTLYSLHEPYPLARFGAPDYSNICTIKHSSLAGADDGTNGLFLASGSDDWRAYVWRVPELASLRERVREADTVPSDEWKELGGGAPAIAYQSPTLPAGAQAASDSASCRRKMVPPRVNVPLHAVETHRSIVNTALLHPHVPMLYTAGVEKVVHAHSPTGIFASELEHRERREPWTAASLADFFMRNPGARQAADDASLPDPQYSGESEEDFERRLTREETFTLFQFDDLVAEDTEAHMRSWLTLDRPPDRADEDLDDDSEDEDSEEEERASNSDDGDDDIGGGGAPHHPLSP